MNIKKNLANLMTGMRIAFSLALFLMIKNPLLFSITYTSCFLTDAFDGTVARATKSESAFGEKFDDIADTIMIICMILVMIIWLQLEALAFIPYLVVIASIRIINGVISFKKYGSVYVTHTYFGKASGVVAWMLPIVYVYTESFFMIHFAAVVLIIESLELTVIFMRSKTYDPNMKSIFKPKQAN